MTKIYFNDVHSVINWIFENINNPEVINCDLALGDYTFNVIFLYDDAKGNLIESMGIDIHKCGKYLTNLHYDKGEDGGVLMGLYEPLTSEADLMSWYKEELQNNVDFYKNKFSCLSSESQMQMIKSALEGTEYEYCDYKFEVDKEFNPDGVLVEIMQDNGIRKRMVKVVTLKFDNEELVLNELYELDDDEEAFVCTKTF